MTDLIILGILLLCALGAIRFLRRQKKAGKGCCGSCAGCHTVCSHKKEEESDT